MTGATRGVLYPARLPTFHRLPPPPTVEHLVRWFWIPEWDLAPGRVSRQAIVSYPASNLVVEPGLVGLAGPTTRASHRDLSGTGWSVGALLRPAAVPAFTDDPTALRDRYVRLDLPDLHRDVAAAMTTGKGDRREGDVDGPPRSTPSRTGWPSGFPRSTRTRSSRTPSPTPSSRTRPSAGSKTSPPASPSRPGRSSAWRAGTSASHRSR